MPVVSEVPLEVPLVSKVSQHLCGLCMVSTVFLVSLVPEVSLCASGVYSASGA